MVAMSATSSLANSSSSVQPVRSRNRVAAAVRSPRVMFCSATTAISTGPRSTRPSPGVTPRGPCGYQHSFCQRDPPLRPRHLADRSKAVLVFLERTCHVARAALRRQVIRHRTSSAGVVSRSCWRLTSRWAPLPRNLKSHRQRDSRRRGFGDGRGTRRSHHRSRFCIDPPRDPGHQGALAGPHSP